MPPSFINFKGLRRRSKASFRTDRSTDTSSDGAVSQGTTTSSGSVTPPSIAHQSDPALNLQVKDSNASSQQQEQPLSRPPLAPVTNTNRYSVSGMSGLGAPSMQGRQSLPVSQYAPRISNVSENAWVRLIFHQRHAVLSLDAGLGANLLHPRSHDICCPSWSPTTFDTY